MIDDDNISIETNYERGLREKIKADYSKAAETDPIGESFRAVGSHAYNLKNVESLREKYPEEYLSRMKASAVKPLTDEGKLMDSYWYAHSFAGAILKGVFDSDNLQEVEERFGKDNFGIPEEFLDLEEVQNYMKQLVERPWANEEVCGYLRERFNIPEDPEKPVRRYQIDARQFG